MKSIFTAIIICFSVSLFGQVKQEYAFLNEVMRFYNIPKCITDSVKWVVIDTLSIGNYKHCDHSFAYSSKDIFDNLTSMTSCSVYHGEGCHCDLDNQKRKAICRKCKLHISEEEITYQHTIPVAKSEYELLLDSLNRK